MTSSKNWTPINFYCDQCKKKHRGATEQELQDGVYWIDHVLHVNEEHPSLIKNAKEISDAIDKEILDELIKESK